MKKTTKARLRKSEEGMSTRELVFAELERARSAGSLIAHARRLASEPHVPEQCLFARIGDAMHERMKNAEPKDRIRAKKRAGLEASYLISLMHHCNTHLLQHQKEWMLRGSLLVLLLSSMPDEFEEDAVEMLVAIMRMHCREVQRFGIVVDALSKCEFEGRDVLLPKERKLLNEELKRSKRYAEAMQKAVPEAWRGPQLLDEVKREAEEELAAWRALSRGSAFGHLGFDRASLDELRPLIE